MPKIKICGLFREQDIEFANEAMPDFIGFVFAKSHRQINSETAALFKKRLNPQIPSIIELYNSGIVNIAHFSPKKPTFLTFFCKIFLFPEKNCIFILRMANLLTNQKTQRCLQSRLELLNAHSLSAEHFLPIEFAPPM
jgi:hypothetical protein